MTKEQMLVFLGGLKDGEIVDEYELTAYMRQLNENRRLWMEELEERQHSSGFYAQQDLIAMYKHER